MFSYPPFMESISLIDDEEAQNLTYYANLAQQAWNAVCLVVYIFLMDKGTR